MTKKPATPELQKLIDAEPHLVDAIVDYIFSEPELRQAIEQMKTRIGPDAKSRIKKDLCLRFKGVISRVGDSTPELRAELSTKILSMFNGRNAREVARRLNISRATVYRHIKQPGRGA